MRTKQLLAFLLLAPLLLASPHIVKGNGGTVHTITYHSTTQDTECYMNIYLPYGYDLPSDSANSYPVFYLIHGGSENYGHWVNSGNANTTLDDFIASDIAVPMILVMPDGKDLDSDVFCDELLNDIIPYIESNYRVKADREHRGVGGLSWGGLQAMEPGIFHYELFGYMAILSSGWFTTDNATYSRARDFLSTHQEDLLSSVRYWYFSQGGPSDIAYENGKQTMSTIRDAGITVHYWEHPGGHSWTAWREDLKSFLPFLFRDSTTRYVALDFQGGNITTATIMINVDSLIPEPSIPTRTGYTFCGWYKEAEGVNAFDFTNDTIRDHLTIYAQWDINSYTIDFNSNGGSAVDDVIVAEYNTTISAPQEPVKSGYVFDGWYTNDSFTKKWNFNTDWVSQDLTLIAKWIDEASLSVNLNAKVDIKIIPNPASSEIRIANYPSQASVAIYNIQGRLMVLKDMDAYSHAISVEALPQGIYLVKLSSTDFVYQQRLMVKR